MEGILTQITKDASSVKYAHVKKAAQDALGNVTSLTMLKVRHFVIVKRTILMMMLIEDLYIFAVKQKISTKYVMYTDLL